MELSGGEGNSNWSDEGANLCDSHADAHSPCIWLWTHHQARTTLPPASWQNTQVAASGGGEEGGNCSSWSPWSQFKINRSHIEMDAGQVCVNNLEHEVQLQTTEGIRQGEENGGVVVDSLSAVIYMHLPVWMWLQTLFFILSLSAAVPRRFVFWSQPDSAGLGTPSLEMHIMQRVSTVNKKQNSTIQNSATFLCVQNISSVLCLEEQIVCQE